MSGSLGAERSTFRVRKAGCPAGKALSFPTIPWARCEGTLLISLQNPGLLTGVFCAALTFCNNTAAPDNGWLRAAAAKLCPAKPGHHQTRPAHGRSCPSLPLPLHSLKIPRAFSRAASTSFPFSTGINKAEQPLPAGRAGETHPSEPCQGRNPPERNISEAFYKNCSKRGKAQLTPLVPQTKSQ